MKFIITKYALTTGVFSASGSIVDGSPHMIKVATKHGGYFHKPDWHISVGDAIERVHAMREAARKSLRKKAAKLDAMDVEGTVIDATT